MKAFGSQLDPIFSASAKDLRDPFNLQELTVPICKGTSVGVGGAYLDLKVTNLAWRDCARPCGVAGFGTAPSSITSLSA